MSNLAAGILLVMFRPFRAGEYADLGGVAGTVQNVHIFSTTMRTLDGKIVVIPNGKIIAGEIVNFCKRKLTAVCSHQTRIGNLDAHLTQTDI